MRVWDALKRIKGKGGKEKEKTYIKRVGEKTHMHNPLCMTPDVAWMAEGCG